MGLVSSGRGFSMSEAVNEILIVTGVWVVTGVVVFAVAVRLYKAITGG